MHVCAWVYVCACVRFYKKEPFVCFYINCAITDDHQQTLSLFTFHVFTSGGTAPTGSNLKLWTPLKLTGQSDPMINEQVYLAFYNDMRWSLKKPSDFIDQSAKQTHSPSVATRELSLCLSLIYMHSENQTQLFRPRKAESSTVYSNQWRG